MTSSAETHHDSSKRLRQLVARGFRLMPPVRDKDGELMALIYVRPHGDIIDIVELRGEDDVRAARVPRDDRIRDDRASTHWRTAGSVCEVLDQVLALPERLIRAWA
ncbi:hypothetical protein [Saccharopolyspora phatthalungensis]|uniref:Uncharacterized protein n=1 Tax=Saccharopolyspora phatthalungensis TaxID=664693 RepID=A0A840QDB2_9PSEU|nr:hypothetical protein [Saccharopolyspora phatthalungensis]MBB5156628.1 hypothetical protein [Saccharopolyspora phatthalungensis]